MSTLAGISQLNTNRSNRIYYRSVIHGFFKLPDLNKGLVEEAGFEPA